MVNPTHLVCMYLIKFVEFATTMLRGVHVNKSRLDKKSDGHAFGIAVPSHQHKLLIFVNVHREFHKRTDTVIIFNRKVSYLSTRKQ